MNEPKKFPTLANLLSSWLHRFPNDMDHPDLIDMATEGRIETVHGYMTPKEYEAFHCNGWTSRTPRTIYTDEPEKT